jgi:ethanolamine utilization protein EutN
MEMARVVGQVVSTIKHAGLAGFTLLLVEEVDQTGQPHGNSERSEAQVPYVALDLTGAGTGEVVLIARGSGARVPEQSSGAPTDAAAVAIVDSVVLGTQVSFTTGS